MTALDKLRALIEAYNPASSQRTDESVKAHHDLALLAHAYLLPALEALENEWEYNHAEHCGGKGEHNCQWPNPSVLAQLEEALK